MAEQVWLHVGTMKSGTSYLQRRLDRNSEALAAQGICFPGEGWGAQAHAVGDLLGRQRLGGPKRAGAWPRLVAELTGWTGRGLISMELLGAAAPRKIRRCVADLAAGGADAVRVVVTARDLNRAIPAMWQETLKNGRTADWEAYRQGVRRDRGPGVNFWREQDLARMVSEWAAVVGPEQVTVVTVPPPGSPPETLWDRFAGTVGIEPGSCEPIAAANESLGLESALVLLEVNRRLESRALPWRGYNAAVKRELGSKVMASRRKEEQPLGMPVERWVERRSARLRDQVAASGVRVVGDLEDLRPVPVPGAAPEDVPAEALLAAAIDGLAGVAERQARRRAKQG